MGCGEARDGFRRERAYRERQFEREAAILEAISRKVAENRASLATRTEDFERRHAAFRRRVEKERALKNDASFKKSLQLYQRMDPELVARDFEQKWAAGDEERRAVVETLRELPSRLSAEIIDAMTSSETRVAIMKEIRRGQSRPSSSGRS